MSTSEKKKIVSYYIFVAILFIISCSNLVRSSQLRAENKDRSNVSPLLATQHANNDAQKYDHVVSSRELMGDKYPNIGASFVGIGYDIFKGNPEGDPTVNTMVDPGFRLGVVDCEYNQQFRTAGMRKLRPRYGFARKEIACQMAKQVSTEKVSTEYSKSLQVDASVSAGASGGGMSGAFGASGGFKRFKSNIESNGVERMVMKSYCLEYRSAVDINMPLKVTKAFGERVNSLKPCGANCLDNDKLLWNKLFDDFGTHFLSDVHFGGKMLNSMLMKSSTVNRLRNKGVNAAAQLSGSAKGMSGGLAVSGSSDTKKKETFEKVEKCFLQMTLGGSPHESFSDWASSVPDSPMPVKYKLTPFSALKIFKNNNLGQTYLAQLNIKNKYVEDHDINNIFQDDIEDVLSKKDILLPGGKGWRKCSDLGTSGAVNGGASCGLLNRKTSTKASINAGEGDLAKALSVTNDGNLRITAEYGGDDTVWNNGVIAEEGMYCMEYTHKNNFVIYHADESIEKPIWQTGTNRCSEKPGFVRLDKDGTVEVWGFKYDEKGPGLTLFWYAGKDTPANGYSRCGPLKEEGYVFVAEGGCTNDENEVREKCEDHQEYGSACVAFGKQSNGCWHLLKHGNENKKNKNDYDPFKILSTEQGEENMVQERQQKSVDEAKKIARLGSLSMFKYLGCSKTDHVDSITAIGENVYYLGEAGCHNDKAKVKNLCEDTEKCIAYGQQTNLCWHLLQAQGADRKRPGSTYYTESFTWQKQTWREYGPLYYLDEGGCTNDKNIPKEKCKKNGKCIGIGQQPNGCWHLLQKTGSQKKQMQDYYPGCTRCYESFHRSSWGGNFGYIGEGGCHNNAKHAMNECDKDGGCMVIGQQSNGCWHKKKV